MEQQLVIRGVPSRIKQDGWWLTAATPNGAESAGPPDSPVEIRESARPFTVPVLLLLVLLADWLFWEKGPGVSVAVFAMAFCAIILASKKTGATRKEWLLWMSAEIALNLPVIELLQPLSLFFAGLGIVAITVWVAYDRFVTWWQALWLMLRVSSVGAAILPVKVVRDVTEFKPGSDFRKNIMALIMPAGVGLVFLLLLTSANPLLDRALQHVASLDFIDADYAFRFVFWLVAASLIWPYLHLQGAWVGPVAVGRTRQQQTRQRSNDLFNPASVRNALVLFNAMFLVQTTLDIGVLSGGAALPAGMTYAEYAHRGAYPLVLTALLAGIFAIASHRMIEGHPMLRALMYLWLGQTLFLVLTAAFRLQLYVDVYSLTYLRVRAFIWMGLVFVGLGLIVFMMARNKGIGWLIRSNLITVGATLYICCFVNFAYLIAAYNFASRPELGRFDPQYMCQLGEQALPVIIAFETETGGQACSPYLRPWLDPISDWREWGFRRWRLEVYLDANAQEPV